MKSIGSIREFPATVSSSLLLSCICMLSSRVLASNTSVPDTVYTLLPLPSPPPPVSARARMAYLAFGLRYCGRWDTYKLRFYRYRKSGITNGPTETLYARSGPRLCVYISPLLFRLFLQTGGRDTPPAHSSPRTSSGGGGGRRRRATKKTGGGDKTEKWPSSNKSSPPPSNRVPPW